MGMSSNSLDYMALDLLFYIKVYQKLVFYWMDLQHTVPEIFHIPLNNSKPVVWGYDLLLFLSVVEDLNWEVS